MGIEVLEKKGALRILLKLRDGPKPITQLMKDLGLGQDRVYTSVEDFKADGIIEDNKMIVFPYPRTISLTERGLRLSILISQMNVIIDEIWRIDEDFLRHHSFSPPPQP